MNALRFKVLTIERSKGSIHGMDGDGRDVFEPCERRTIVLVPARYGEAANGEIRLVLTVGSGAERFDLDDEFEVELKRARP